MQVCHHVSTHFLFLATFALDRQGVRLDRIILHEGGQKCGDLGAMLQFLLCG